MGQRSRHRAVISWIALLLVCLGLAWHAVRRQHSPLEPDLSRVGGALVQRASASPSLSPTIAPHASD